MKSIQRILTVLCLSAGVLALSNCATSGGSCSACEAGAAKKCSVCGKAGCTACEAKMKH